MKTISLLTLVLFTFTTFAAGPQLPKPQSLKKPITVREYERKRAILSQPKIGAADRIAVQKSLALSIVIPTNRVRCTTNCPVARTSFTVEWNWPGIQWDPSPNAIQVNVTNYTVKLGQKSRTWTNDVSVATNLSLSLSNQMPAGTNFAIVTATSIAQLESDPSSEVMVEFWRTFNVYDLSSLATAPPKRIAVVQDANTWSSPLTNLVDKLFAIGVRGTNSATGKQTGWLKMRVK